MKVIIVFAVFVAVAAAAPAQPNVVVIKEIPLYNIGIDDYRFGYELSDGQARREYGQVKNFGTKDEAMFVEGSYSYVDPLTNVLYVTTYTADETGYHPVVSTTQL